MTTQRHADQTSESTDRPELDAAIREEQSYVDTLFRRLDDEVARANERLADVMRDVDPTNPDPEALVRAGGERRHAAHECEWHAGHVSTRGAGQSDGACSGPPTVPCERAAPPSPSAANNGYPAHTLPAQHSTVQYSTYVHS